MREFYLVALSFLVMIIASLVTTFALAQHRNFLTIACDTAVEQCAIVNTLHGNLFCNNGAGGGNILASHTTFILLFLAPIYALAPSVDTLFVLQVWGVYTAVIPLFLLANVLLQRPFLAFFVACGALASPLLLHMALAPFHPETWILSAVFWSYYFYLSNKFWCFVGSFLFSVCCGEHAAIIYVSLGLSLLLSSDNFYWRRQYGAFALLAGFAWLILSLATATHFTRPFDTFNNVSYHYQQWGILEFSGLPTALASHPLSAFVSLLDLSRWKHLIELVGLPVLMAFFTWRSFIILAPFPIYFLMDNQEFYLYFHAYYFEFCMFAGYLGLVTALVRLDLTQTTNAAIVSVTFLTNIIILAPAMSFYLQMNACRDDEASDTLRHIFRHIPSQAAIYCPHRFSAYLSNRDDIVIGDLREKNLDFDAMMTAQSKINNLQPDKIDYIVSDYMTDQCGWRFGFLSEQLVRRRQENIKALLQTGQWRVFWEQHDVVILCRKKR